MIAFCSLLAMLAIHNEVSILHRRMNLPHFLLRLRPNFVLGETRTDYFLSALLRLARSMCSLHRNDRNDVSKTGVITSSSSISLHYIYLPSWAIPAGLGLLPGRVFTCAV